MDSSQATREARAVGEKRVAAADVNVSPRWIVWLVAAVAACALAPLAYPLVTGRVFSQDDLSSFHLPLRSVYQTALVRHQSTDWTSALLSGFYLLGEGQLGTTHPFHQLLYRALPLGVAFNVEIIGSYLLAFAGTFAFLRNRRFDRPPAIVGALLFGLSGFNVLHLNHVNLVAVAAHIPWVLFAIDRIVTGTTPRSRVGGYVILAVTLGSQLLLGYPQSVWMAALAAAYVTLTHIRRLDVRSSLALAGAVACGLAIGTMQLLPTLDEARRSLRAAYTLEYAVSFSLHPANLVQLVNPYLFTAWVVSPVPLERMLHEFGVYNGAFATIALLWLFERRRSLARKRLAVAAAIGAACALVLALGSYARIYTLLARFPPLSSLRGPARHIVLVHFAMAVLGACAFEELLRVRVTRSERAGLATFLIATLATIVTTVGVSWWGRGLGDVDTGPAIAGAAVFVAIAALVWWTAKGSRVALALLTFALAADLAFWGFRYVWEQPILTADEIARQFPAPPLGTRGDRLFSPVPPATTNILLLRGFRLTTGYLGLLSIRTLDPADANAQRAAGAQWARGLRGWAPVDRPVARARLMTRAQVSVDPRTDIRTIDPQEVALVDAPLDLLGSPGNATVKVDDPGRIVVSVDAPTTQLLVVTEHYDDRWTVTDATAVLPLVRVYGEFIGCVVAPGVRDVTFTFAPASARIGRRVSLAGILALMASALAFAFLDRPINPEIRQTET